MNSGLAAPADTRPAAANLADMAAERWFFALMTLLLFATALVGFVPSSIGKIAAVSAGQRPPFPPVLHVHAVLMGAWMTLLLVQGFLVPTGNVAVHRRLGLVGFALVPALLLTMVLVTRNIWITVAGLPADAMPPAQLAATRTFLSNILLGQIESFVLFALFIGWALAVRRTDSGTHKRLMLLGTLMPLMAAIDRATGRWGISTLPDSMVSLHGHALVLLLPALVFDVVRYGRVHRAWVIGLAVVLPFFLTIHLLWGTPRWLATAPAIMGALGVKNW